MAFLLQRMIIVALGVVRRQVADASRPTYRSCGSYGGEHIVFERTFVCFNPVLFVRLLFVRAFDSGYLFESRRCVDRVSGGVSSDRTISPNLSQFFARVV